MCICACVCARALKLIRIQNDTPISIVVFVIHPVSNLSSYPNTDTIAGASSGIRKWLDDQVSMKPTLHRAFFRERANPRTQVHQQVWVKSEG